MAYLPGTFTPTWSMPQAAQPTQGIIWVDGEVGAKAYQLPAGWPANTPIALWDTNDTVIYLKSINQMGMPVPLQKAHYKLEQAQSSSGEMDEKYVTKDEIRELRDAIEKLTAGRKEE